MPMARSTIGVWGAQPIQNTEKVVVKMRIMLLLSYLRLPPVIMP